MGWNTQKSNDKYLKQNFLKLKNDKRCEEKLKIKGARKKNHNPINFIAQWRDLPIYELISYPLMFASVPMLIYGIQTYDIGIIKIIILCILTLYSGFIAALIWNDITDVEIDRIAHPKRPIPSGRINSKKFFIIALLFSILTFIFAFLISIICLILVGLAAIFVALHNKYLKRRINFPAYSEIFSPLQWTVVALFGAISIWSALPQSSDILIKIPLFGNLSTSNIAIQQLLILICFIYFADSAHDIIEGIHDAEADEKHNIKTYTTTFGWETALNVAILMFVFSGIVGIILFIKTILSYIFLFSFLIIFFYILYNFLKLFKYKKEEIVDQGIVFGRKLYNYYIFSFNLIFIDLLIQILF
jgi:geranylgeranylglycerol-phosphate geranylgeranyltransferase